MCAAKKIGWELPAIRIWFAKKAKNRSAGGSMAYWLSTTQCTRRATPLRHPHCSNLKRWVQLTIADIGCAKTKAHDCQRTQQSHSNHNNQRTQQSKHNTNRTTYWGLHVPDPHARRVWDWDSKQHTLVHILYVLFIDVLRSTPAVISIYVCDIYVCFVLVSGWQKTWLRERSWWAMHIGLCILTRKTNQSLGSIL